MFLIPSPDEKERKKKRLRKKISRLRRETNLLPKQGSESVYVCVNFENLREIANCLYFLACR